MRSLSAPFNQLLRGDTYGPFVFLAGAVPLGAAALGLIIAGWTASGLLAVTPLVVPVLIAFRGAVGLLAAGDAALARSVLGVDVRPRLGSGGTGYWRRGKAVVTDPVFWKQQAYLVLRMTLGFGLAVGLFSLAAVALGALAYPAWYRWSDPTFHIGSWHVDTLAGSFAAVPFGVVGVVVTAWVARGLGAASAWLVRALLGEPGLRERVPPVSRAARRRALAIHAASAAGVCAVLVVVWALTARGYFWPEWALLPLALLVSVHGWVELVDERRGLRREQGLLVHAGISVELVAFLTAIWALTTRGYFWPMWPALGAAVALGVRAAAEYGLRGTRLAQRVGELEIRRAGAVDAQEANLRRIERDLHDGAQARLVALGMNLGLAEQKLASDPEGAHVLVAEARAGIVEALRELRDLARGIHPPVLSDRGLGAALATLADRSAIPVAVAVDLAERPAPTVETAAYFVAAEALANAAKHSGATQVDIRVRRREDVLEVEIADDGRGGADPRGGGLTGLRRRVEALDGELRVASPAGGPTVVRAELPCAS